MLRQMGHARDLPFDQIIGTKPGKSYKNTRPNSALEFQPLKDYQVITTHSEELVDIHRLLMALETYCHILPGSKKTIRINHHTLSEITIDAATTWANDLASAAIDAFIYFSNHSATRTLAERENVLDHFFRTRAPEHKLIPTLDAWAQAVRVAHSSQNTSIEEAIRVLYGPYTTPITRANSRRLALERFFTHYDLKFENSTMNTARNKEILSHHVIELSRLWISVDPSTGRSRSKPFELSSYWEKQAQGMSLSMADRFLRWLTHQHKITQTASGQDLKQ
jgi:hypothetical protein